MSKVVRIVGGGEVGTQVADRLANRGDEIMLIEQTAERVAELRDQGYRVHEGDGTDSDVLEAANTGAADIVVVATGDDDSNLLVAQLAKTRYGTDTIIANVAEQKNQEPFEELGIETVSRPVSTARYIDGYIESPALARWTESLGQVGDVQEVPVTNERLVGKTIGQLVEVLPDRCLITVVGEEGNAHFPDHDEEVVAGQHLTLVGERDAVQAGVELFTPDSDADTEVVES